MSEIRVVGLFSHPVKGCAPVRLQSLSVSLYGAAGDRIFVIVDEKGRMVTQRTEPRLCLIQPELSLDGAEVGPQALVLRAPGMEDLRLRRPEVRGDQQGGSTRIHADLVGSAHCGPKAAAWLSGFLGYPASLRVCARWSRLRESTKPYVGERQNLAFQDGLPLLVCSVESIAAFNKALAAMAPDERAKTALNFRPNILVEGAGAFDELSWGRFSHQDPGEEGPRFGNFAGLKRCDRCGVPDVDPETGVVSNPAGLTIRVLKELGMEMPVYPSTSIGSERRAVFGMNAAWLPSRSNVIALGSAITVSERWPQGR